LSTIEIRFAVDFSGGNRTEDLNGPLFFRFLPDGEADAIEVSTGHEAYSLSLWFERRGYVDHRGLLVWDAKRREVPADLVSRQGILQAGPLFGQLKVNDVTDAELKALRANLTGDSEYVAFAKRCLDIIVPHSSRLIKILRDTYGQYWIPELHTWDSRTVTLGAYCRNTLQIRWRETADSTYLDFIPTQQNFTIILEMDDWDNPQYISAADWHEMHKLMAQKFEPPLVSSVTARANELLEEGNMRHAIIEAVTAIEIAIGDVMTRAAVDRNELKFFWSTGLQNRLMMVAAARGDLDRESLDKMLELINLRNKIVHEGRSASEISRPLVRMVLRALKCWIDGPPPRFPRASHGNRLWGKDEDDNPKVSNSTCS
jgi:hypothetical protein